MPQPNDAAQPEPTGTPEAAPAEAAPQTPGEETPAAQETPTGAPAAEPTPGEEQKKEQTPDVLKSLQESRDRVAEFSKQLGDIETPQEKPEATVPEKSALPSLSSEATTQLPQGQDDLNEILRTDPLLGLSAVAEHIVGEIRKDLSKQQKDQALQMASREANRALATFANQHGYGAEDIKAATDEVTKLGLKGDPRSITSLIVDRMEKGRLSKLFSEGTQAAHDKAAQAGLSAALTAQPSGGAAPPTKPKTIEQVVEDKFVPSAKKVSIDKLLGKT